MSVTSAGGKVTEPGALGCSAACIPNERRKAGFPLELDGGGESDLPFGQVHGCLTPRPGPWEVRGVPAGTPSRMSGGEVVPGKVRGSGTDPRKPLSNWGHVRGQK